MEREANYTAVGAFVLLVTIMAGLFVYWYTGSSEQRSYTRYEIYFNGTVSGLETGGAVRFLGVDIGRVVRIRIDSRANNRVQVIVDVDSTTPVSDKTVAQLSLQGVTGLLYIDLQQQLNPDTSKGELVTVPSERYPVIRSLPSDFDVFLASLPEVTVRASELVTRLNRLFSDDNIGAISRLATNLDRAGATLPASAQQLTALLSDLRATSAAASQVAQQLRSSFATMAPDVEGAMNRLHAASDNLASASVQLDGLIKENRAGLHTFVTEGLPQLEALVRESRATARQIEELSRSLKENPARLIYQPAPAGVEIPR
jgi:phospholipid/cholesterol/gamma-HCH transport system substrate-binding protein